MVIQLMNDGDMATAQSMFDAAGCTAPTGNLINGVYDAHGALYQIPENIICDPVDLDESKKVIEDGGEEEAAEEQKRREEKGKAVLRGETLKVRCRLSDSHGKDVVIQMGREETVRVLIGRIKEQTGVSRHPTTLNKPY